MKTIQFKCVVTACLLAFGLVSHSFAVDVAEAASVLNDLETLAIQAKANLANASLENLGATDVANQQSAEIDKAVDAGRDALAAMEEAVANGEVGVDANGGQQGDGFRHAFPNCRCQLKVGGVPGRR